MWRLAAGNIVGSAFFGTIGFVIANFFGLQPATVLIALLLALSPLILFREGKFRRRFWGDWKQAINRNQGVSAMKIRRLAYYVFFFLLFLIFFDRAMFEMRDGIYTGGAQNLGDLPFHLGAIFSFTEGNNFPPENPSFAGAKFSYPFIADFLSACFVRLGASVKDAMFVQNVFWALSLLVILERFVFKFTNNRFAGKIAPALLFFSGGFGFLWFLNDFWQSSQGFFDFLYKLPRDYTIGGKFSWGNSLVTLFITQRSLLIGMPLTIIVLQKLWRIFTTENTKTLEEERRRRGEEERKSENRSIKTDAEEKQSSKAKEQMLSPLLLFSSSAFLVGLLAGTLPLIHLHSLAVLFVVAACLFFMKPEKRLELTAFGVGVGLIAVPALLWSMSGSATRASEFFAWHFGWNKAADENFLWFWLRNTGIFIPILLFGIYLIFSTRKRADAELEEKKQKEKTKEKAKENEKINDRNPKVKDQILFYLPFIFLFLISNAAKLAPWEWDNIKVLIYWFVGSLPFAAFALAWLWRKNNILKIVAAGCFAMLIFAGATDVWRVASKQINYKVFERDAAEIARDINLRTLPGALFLNAPTYNSAIVLSGRRSLMRYPGHLSSHGINYAERENDLKRIYEGDAAAEVLLRKYNIEYVLVSPEERSLLTVNDQYFAKYPILAESGQYRVYKIK